MIAIFMILGLMSLVVGLYLAYISETPTGVLYAIILAGISILCFVTASIISIYNTNHPTALDVYRGRTTLEITYKDSIAIDSVVVFKNN